MRDIINISLPPEMVKEIKREVRVNNFASVSEFMRHLIRLYNTYKLADELKDERKRFRRGQYQVLRSLKGLKLIIIAMEIRYRPRFKREYRKLSAVIRKQAVHVEKIFRDDPFDPQLRTHKLHGPLSDFYAFSIDYRHRIIFAFVDKKIVEFYSVGDHNIYE